MKKITIYLKRDSNFDKISIDIDALLKLESFNSNYLLFYTIYYKTTYNKFNTENKT